MKKGNSKMNAVTVRNFLAFAMVIIVLGATVGFYFGLQLIKTYALDVSHTVSDASASGRNVKQLSVLKTQLAERETLVTKANQLFATQDTYQLQSLKDLQKYAGEVGISITNTEFDTGTTPPPAAGATPTATAGHSIVVTLQSPVSYAKFIQFLDAIEGNLPKMQITGVSISRPDNASGDQIITDKITITVATR
ncbi:MAG: hypothetical protein JWO99_741 [Candidatus Saccharibacteria bacterium]|nr:hypothetical protein [Candidatus Saccharibacteria bacterium]